MSDNPNVVTIEDDEPSAPAPAPVKNEAAPVQPPAPEPEAAPEEDKGKRGTKYVEMPEEIEARFKRIYGNLKATQRDNEKLFSANQRLIERLDALEQGQAQRQATSQMGGLKDAYAQALATADYQRAADIQEQMLELKTAAKDVGVKVETPRQTEPDLDLSKAEQSTVVAWGSQTDEDGQPLRPWASPDHGKFLKFQNALRTVTEDPDFAGSNIGSILSEVDRIMGAAGQQQRRAAAPVLNSSPEASTRAARAAPLSDVEKRVAEKMFWNTRIAKTQEDAHNLFRRNKSNGSNRMTVED